MDFEIISSKFENDYIDTVNARDIHEYVGSKREFSTWIKKRIGIYGFEENIDFLTWFINVN